MGILAQIIDPAATQIYWAGLAERNATLDAQIAALSDAILIDEVAKFFE